MTGTRRAFMWATLVLAAIVVVGVFLQVYFIAAYFFGASDALDAHEVVGGAIVHPAEALAFIALLVALWGAWKEVAFTFLLPLVGTIQLVFVPEDDADRGSGWVHGLHGLLAMAVLVLAAIVVHRAMRRLDLRRTAAPAP